MRYAPAREDGLKPYLVMIREWGRERSRIVYAAKASEAVYEAKGRSRYITARARRATPEDMDRSPFVG